MKQKEKWAAEWVTNFAKQLPGSFDHSEGVKCFLAGFHMAQRNIEAYATIFGEIEVKESKSTWVRNKDEGVT